jgi:glutamyl-tRNA reductase
VNLAGLASAQRLQSSPVPRDRATYPSQIRFGGAVSKQKLAFIGLGVMGFPMAGHLVGKGGHELTVYNRTRAKADAWAAKHGGRVAATPAKD